MIFSLFIQKPLMWVIWQDAHKVFLEQYNINVFSVLLMCVT